jgi:signal transduction histidine kinase
LSSLAKSGIEIIKSNVMQMQQVILNILLNAKDAMFNGGKNYYKK